MESGNGLNANLFRKRRENVVFFASGVSTSSEPKKIVPGFAKKILENT